jgi:hypothetical protein
MGGLEASCFPGQWLRTRAPPSVASPTQWLAVLPGRTGSGNGPIRGPCAGPGGMKIVRWVRNVPASNPRTFTAKSVERARSFCYQTAI